MPKIIVAKTAGFCMGVRRAVEMVIDSSNNNDEKICTYGPLIHNPQVLDLLEEKGIPALSEIPKTGSGTVFIRAHGVPPSAKTKLVTAGFKIIDATCPRVIKVQTIISQHAKKGYTSIIIGDKDHPEVEGLLGYSMGNGYAVNTMEQIENLPFFENAIIVAQTTQNTSFYNDISKWIEKKYPHYKIFNTICDSTEKRQAEITELAKTADAVVVVGGKNSGNTQRLADIIKETGKPSFHIENISELNINNLAFAKTIAITAGASSPNWIIKSVYKKLSSSLLIQNNNLPFPISIRNTAHHLLELSILTNLFQAFGAASLSFACTKLQGMEHGLQHALIAMLYILSMQIFNNLTTIESDKYNNPDRSVFYKSNKILFFGIAITSGAAGLILAYGLGGLPFSILFIMSLLGLIYNLRIIPENSYFNKYQKIKDIPGSKTILIATAWGVVTSVLPALSLSGKITIATFIAFTLSTGMVFARTAFFDIMDMQGDKIAGKETIPTLIGSKKCFKLIKYILLTISFMIFASIPLKLISPHSVIFGLILGFFPISMLISIMHCKQDQSYQGTKQELLLESHFILTGIAVFIWNLF